MSSRAEHLTVPTIRAVRTTPILIADPPLLNRQGVHEPFTPRLIVAVETADGVVGLGGTYGDASYLEVAARIAPTLAGRPIHELHRSFLSRESTDVPRMPMARPVTLASPDESSVSQPTAVANPAIDAGGLRGARTVGKLEASVFSAFEVACLDALGKTVGLPVHALLGGKVRDAVDYSAYLFYRWAEHPDGYAERATDDWDEALDPDGIVKQAKRFTEQYGFASYKLKGGVFAPEEEVAAIHALRKEFPRSPLRLDPTVPGRSM